MGMRKRLAGVLVATVATCAGQLVAQRQEPDARSHRVLIRAGRLIDGRGGQAVLANALIAVEDGRITGVSAGSAPPGAETIDLTNATVLPGLIDAHTHIFLQGDATSAEYDEQLLKQSIPYRAVLAARNARLALDRGFTTLRDLETEGAMYADVDVKTAIDRGEVPGPRLFVSTRAMAPTGMYPLLGYSWELDVPHGVQPVDGVEHARLAVREQVSRGADWIKYYADRAYSFGADGILHGKVNFTDDEARAIVDETHRLGHRVAAHAMSADGIAAALKAGVDSIEHGPGLTDAEMDDMVRRGTYWVPTVMAVAAIAPARGGAYLRMMEAEKAAFGRALKKGVKIVNGTDIGAFPWPGANQAQELHYYVDWGMTPMDAIRSATSGAAQLLDQSDRLGTIEAGRFADIIATADDPSKNIAALDHVAFVMKNGVVYKNELHR
jgi:imidazolonepropionase-like amidohydrolase